MGVKIGPSKDGLRSEINLQTSVDAGNATPTAEGMGEIIPLSRTRRAQPSDNRTEDKNIYHTRKAWDPGE